MQKISLLVFSRNDVDKSLDLIKNMYGSVDEIVAIDSSSRKMHKKLLDEKRRGRLAKLRIFYVVPLGYLEPAVMYAIKKCRSDWVLLLGNDERLGPSLKSDLHKLVDGPDCAAFSVRRYEEVGDDNKRGAYTNWQTRLFRRGRISFGGIIHEEPVVSGTTLKLVREDYFIDHVDKLKGNSSKEYSVMEKFLRMSYRSFNERLVDYFYKITVPQRKGSAGSFGRTLTVVLLFYEKLGGKKLDSEISNLDYFMFLYLKAVASYLKEGRPEGIILGYKGVKADMAVLKGWQNEPDGPENFEISNVLYRIGLIKFLELDKERTISKLNERYGREKGGISLLIKLLKLRYEKGKGWLD